MSRMLDANGALITAPQQAEAHWETIYELRGTHNAFNISQWDLNDYEWRNTDLVQIKIFWHFANNGVRLRLRGGITKIAGTKLIEGTSNTVRDWSFTATNTDQQIVPWQNAEVGADTRQEYGQWVFGQMDLQRDKPLGQQTGWAGSIKIDSVVATFNGAIHADYRVPHILPLFSQNATQYMSLDILGRRA